MFSDTYSPLFLSFLVFCHSFIHESTDPCLLVLIWENWRFLFLTTFGERNWKISFDQKLLQKISKYFQICNTLTDLIIFQASTCGWTWNPSHINCIIPQQPNTRLEFPPKGISLINRETQYQFNLDTQFLSMCYQDFLEQQQISMIWSSIKGNANCTMKLKDSSFWRNIQEVGVSLSVLYKKPCHCASACHGTIPMVLQNGQYVNYLVAIVLTW